MKPDCQNQNLPVPGAECGPAGADQHSAATLQSSAEALVHQLDVHRIELHAQTDALHDIEHELENSRDRYISLFDHAPIAYIMLDDRGCISEINLPAAALLGIDRNKLLHRRFARFLHADGTNTWRRFLHNDLKHDDRHSCELKLQRSDGKAFWARLGGRRHLEKEGKVVVRLAIEDISERKLLEQALRDITADLKRAQAVAQVGNWRLDIRTHQLSWSDENYLIFGISPRIEMTYERFLAAVHPQDRAMVERSWADALRGHPYDVEHRIVVDDKVKWVRERGDLEFNIQGDPLDCFGTTQDITERKLAEEALSRKQRYQRALLDNFPFVVWLKDTESRFLAVNSTFAKTFGGDSAESFVGKTDFDLVPETVAKAYLATDREVLASRRQVMLEEEIPDNGNSTWFETYKAPVLDDDGNLLGTVGFAREITTRKEAEAALLHLNDALEEEVAERTAELEARSLALSESERFFRATIDALPSVLCVLDDNATIVAVNKAWREFAVANGGNPDQLSEGANYLAVCDAAAKHLQTSALEVANGIRETLAGKRMSSVLEYECSTPNEQRWFEVSISRFAGEGPVRLVVVHDNITRSKQLAAAQREASLRLKRLAAHLESVREEQSTRIAREIHDELGGTLTMLKLRLATMMDDLTNSTPMVAQFQGMVEQVDAALQTVKRISANLRPGMLDTLGLVATTQWHAEQFSRMTGIAVELNMPDYVRLSTEASTAVFRIIQEGLTNIAKHSGARKVSITLIKHKGNLILRIRDNGKGLPKDSLRKHDSFGLIGMLERAQHLGGELSLTGTPQTGTQLMLRLPLDAGATPATQGEA